MKAEPDKLGRKIPQNDYDRYNQHHARFNFTAFVSFEAKSALQLQTLKGLVQYRCTGRKAMNMETT